MVATVGTGSSHSRFRWCFGLRGAGGTGLLLLRHHVTSVATAAAAAAAAAAVTVMNKRCLLALVLATEEFRQRSSMALLALITHACLERRHRAVVPTCRRLA